MDLQTLRYSAERLWVRLDDDNHATIGLTDEALEDCDALLKIRLPSEGDEFAKDEPFGRISTGHGVGLRLLAPIGGEIIAINEDILDAPEAILEDPYEEGWLVRMEISSMHEYDDLMSREEFDTFIDESFVDDLEVEDAFEPGDDDDLDDDDDDDDDLDDYSDDYDDE